MYASSRRAPGRFALLLKKATKRPLGVNAACYADPSASQPSARLLAKIVDSPQTGDGTVRSPRTPPAARPTGAVNSETTTHARTECENHLLFNSDISRSFLISTRMRTLPTRTTSRAHTLCLTSRAEPTSRSRPAVVIPHYTELGSAISARPGTVK